MNSTVAEFFASNVTNSTVWSLVADSNASNDSLNELDLGWLEYVRLHARHLQTVNGYLILIVSTILNVLLLIVMALEKNETLRAYSTALQLNCVCDLVYTYVAALVDFQLDISDGHIIYVPGGIFPYLSRFWNCAAINAYLSTLGMSVFIIPIIFYYRYNLIVKRIQLSVGRLLAITLAISIFAVWVGFEVALATEYEPNQQTCEEILTHPLWTHGGYTIANCLVTTHENWLMWLHIASIFGINFSVYPFMIFFTLGIFRALKEHEARYNQRTSKIQRQMNMLLMIQLVLPLICGSVPITLIFTFVSLHYTVYGMGNLVMGMMEWIPLINPLVTILLVTNYRQRVWQLLSGRKSKTNDSSQALTKSGQQMSRLATSTAASNHPIIA